MIILLRTVKLFTSSYKTIKKKLQISLILAFSQRMSDLCWPYQESTKLLLEWQSADALLFLDSCWLEEVWGITQRIPRESNPFFSTLTQKLRSTDSALTFLRPDKCWWINPEMAFHVLFVVLGDDEKVNIFSQRNIHGNGSMKIQQVCLGALNQSQQSEVQSRKKINLTSIIIIIITFNSNKF